MYVSVDIDVRDVVDDLTSGEKQKLAAILANDGYDPEEDTGFHADRIQQQLHRMKVLGLDSEMSTVEVLERLLR